MKRFKSVFIILIFILLLNMTTGYTYEYQVENLELAEYLNNLGIFKGTNEGYMLEETATRVQGAVMVVRLLGKEEEALENNYPHPFKDVERWADPYVGYLYEMKITQGIGATTFGSEDLLSGIQYMTLLLRVIEYDDSKGDFSWDKSLYAAYDFDIFNYEEYAKYDSKEVFLRDDLVYFTYAILSGKVKGASYTLYDYLINQGVIVSLVDEDDQEVLLSPKEAEEESQEIETDEVETNETASEAEEESQEVETDETASEAEEESDGMTPPSEDSTSDSNGEVKYDTTLPYEGLSVNTNPANVEELQKSIEIAMYNISPTIILNVSSCSQADYTDIVNQAMTNIERVPGYNAAVKGWKYNSRDSQLIIELEFRISEDEMIEAQEKGKEIIADITSDTMTAYEKELAIHDYLVNTITYDSSAVISEDSYTLYGALVLKKAVCQGYAEAFTYLCHMAGIESDVVSGKAYVNGQCIGHAWNQVLIEGEYYFVDVTWDDPVMADGKNRLRHIYFNVTSEMLGKDHTWDTSTYKVCTATSYNYYVYNDYIVYGVDGFIEKFSECVANSEPYLLVKLANTTLTNQEVVDAMKTVHGWKGFSYSVDEDYGLIEISDIIY